MALLPRPVTMMMFCTPESLASSTPYWIRGLSTTGSISLGCALVAGRKRVPNPAAGKTALRTFAIIGVPILSAWRSQALREESLRRPGMNVRLRRERNQHVSGDASEAGVAGVHKYH